LEIDQGFVMAKTEDIEWPYFLGMPWWNVLCGTLLRLAGIHVLMYKFEAILYPVFACSNADQHFLHILKVLAFHVLLLRFTP